MRTLIPACLLSQPNSLMVSPALKTTSFFTMYSLYTRFLEALCSQAAPQSNSSYITIIVATASQSFGLQCHNATVPLNCTVREKKKRSLSDLVTIDIAVKRTDCRVQPATICTSVLVSKVEHLQYNTPFSPTVIFPLTFYESNMQNIFPFGAVTRLRRN